MTLTQRERARRISLGLCPRCGRGKPRDNKLCFRCALKISRRDAKIKDDAFCKYGGWVCTCCGDLTRLGLQIDHIDNNGAEHRRSTNCGTGIKFYRWLKAEGYPDGFAVLCSTCNIAKQLNGGVCPHVEERRIMLLKLAPFPLLY